MEKPPAAFFPIIFYRDNFNPFPPYTIESEAKEAPQEGEALQAWVSRGLPQPGCLWTRSPTKHYSFPQPTDFRFSRGNFLGFLRNSVRVSSQ
ncbi:hypothetical protein AAMO2058_000400000 [Amorphochlora amoebiformis]